MYTLRYKGPSPGVVQPVLASFPGGPPPDDATFALFGHPDKPRREVRGVAGPSSSLTYSGVARGGPPPPTAGGVLLLGVLDHTARTLEVYPGEGGGTGVVPVSAGLVHSAPEEGSLDARTRRDFLISIFGSKKKQKLEASRKANIVNVGDLADAEDVAADLRAGAVKGKKAAASQPGAAGDSSIASSSDSEQVEGTGAVGSTSEKKIEASLAAARLLMLPPFVASANSVVEAYPLTGLVGEEDWEESTYGSLTRSARSLDEAARAASGASGEESAESAQARLDGMLSRHGRDSLFVAAALGAACASPPSDPEDEEEAKGRIDRLVALLYLRYLVVLHKAPTKLVFKAPKAAVVEGEAPPPAVDVDTLDPSTLEIPSLRWVPAPVRERLLSTFAEPRGSDGRTLFRSPALVDRLACHAAVAALLGCSGNLDLGLLAADFGQTPSALLHYFTQAGCKSEPVRGEAGDEGPTAPGSPKPKRGRVNSYVVTLKTPLVFPRLKLGRRG